MSFTKKLDALVTKFNELEKKLLDPSALGQDYAKVSKEHANLIPIVELINHYQKTKKELKEIEEGLATTTDKEMKDMMEEEKMMLTKKLPEIEQEMKISLLPKDVADEKNAILEIRAGTGGEEAALFGYKLFNIYQKYAEKKRWK